MEAYPKPVSKKCQEKIITQMNNSIYKIHLEEGKFSYCFFCYIKFQSKNIPFMITTYDIIDKRYLSENNSIKVSINNKKIVIRFKDKKYFYQKYDLAIIEIEENKIDNLNIFELDDCLYQEDCELYYNKESIYIINYNKKDEISVSYEIINEINNY